MSRIDTQSDRLLRGEEGFERQRTFLVQPERFASRQTSSADALIRALGQTVGVVADVRADRKAKDDLVKREKQQATMNQLLEARNRANTDPEQFGEEYKRLYQDAIAGTEESDGFRQDILRLDADNFVSGRVEADQRLARSRVSETMSNTFASLSNTYALDADNASEYIALGSTDRFDRIYDEVFDSFPETIQDEILKDDTLKAMLTRSVTATSNKYQRDNDTLVKQQEATQLQKDVDGIAVEFGVSNSFPDETIGAISTRYGIPLDKARLTVLDRTLSSMLLDMEQGVLTPQDAHNKLQLLQSKAEGYGLDAERMVFQTQTNLANLVTQESALDVSGMIEKGLSEGTSLDELADATNDYLLSTLSDYTGLAYNTDTDKIGIVEAPIGLPNTVLAQFRQVQNSVNSRLDAVRKARQKTKSLNSTSTQEQILKDGGRTFIRSGDRAGLETHALHYQVDGAGLSDSELAFVVGQREMHAAAQLGPNSPQGKHFIEAFFEDGAYGKAYAVGAIAQFREDAHFQQAFADLSPEDLWAFTEIRSTLHTAVSDEQGNPVLLTERLQDPEFLTSLEAQYSDSVARYNRVLEWEKDAGSNPIKEKAWNGIRKNLLKHFGLPSDAVISEDFKRRALVETTRYSDSDTDGDQNTSDLMNFITQRLSDNRVPIRRGNTYHLVEDSRGMLPYRQYSEEDVQRDLNEVGLTLGARTFNAFSGWIEFLTMSHPLSPIDTSIDLGVSGTRKRTPSIVPAVADSLGLEPGASLPETVSPLVRDTLVRLSGNSTLTPEATRDLFSNDVEDKNYLRLNLQETKEGFSLVATGLVGNQAFVGPDVIFISQWDPSWNQHIGQREGDSLFTEISEASAAAREEERRVTGRSQVGGFIR